MLTLHLLAVLCISSKHVECYYVLRNNTKPYLGGKEEKQGQIGQQRGASATSCALIAL